MFTRFSNLIFSRNNIAKRSNIRFNTTGTGTGTGAPGAEPGKGKGPVTWKSLAVILTGGAGLLVRTS
jgi:hypothetical protein